MYMGPLASYVRLPAWSRSSALVKPALLDWQRHRRRERRPISSPNIGMCHPVGGVHFRPQFNGNKAETGLLEGFNIGVDQKVICLTKSQHGNSKVGIFLHYSNPALLGDPFVPSILRAPKVRLLLRVYCKVATFAPRLRERVSFTTRVLQSGAPGVRFLYYAGSENEQGTPY